MTPAQLATIKADILANPDLAAVPVGSAGNNTIRDMYNLIGTTDLWSTAVNIDAINNAVDISQYTPIDAADGTAIYTNRALACQTKLMALQTYVLRVTPLDASKSTIRAGLRDSVIKIPAGASGALVTSAGVSGVNALTACTRKATRFEKLFATVSETTGTVTAFIPVLQGQVSLADIEQAREL